MFRKLLILLLALLLCVTAMAETAVETAGDPDPTVNPGDTEAPADPDATPQPARGYVLVRTATQMGFLPLPEEGEYSYHLEQILPDGTPAENVIHVTADGVWMEDSTCDNHDCVNQGEVTLDNRRDRILGNMIICLPNQVQLELYTPDELMEMAESAGDGEGQ